MLWKRQETGPRCGEGQKNGLPIFCKKKKDRFGVIQIDRSLTDYGMVLDAIFSIHDDGEVNPCRCTTPA